MAYEDLLSLTEHLPGEDKGGEEQQERPHSTNSNCGSKWQGKETKKQVASKVMRRRCAEHPLQDPPRRRSILDRDGG